MVLVADDLGGWLVGLLADAARRRLTAWMLGTEQERALRQAVAAALRRTASEVHPQGGREADELAAVVSQVFSTPVPATLLAGHETLLEALQAGVAAQLAPLDDSSMTGVQRSSSDLLGVQVTELARMLTSNLVREIIVRGAAGGPLTPLASQFNDDLTHLQGRRLADMVAQLAGDVREALARLNGQPALSADSAVPAPRHGSASRLEAKLRSLAAQKQLRTVLIGGVYLDLVLYPVDIKQLDHNEWATLERISTQLGGSAYYVGKYLYDQYGQASELVTIVGDAADALSAETARLLSAEPWVSNDPIVDQSRAGTPVSVHLVQRSEEFTTIFTHRGALDHLAWRDIRRASKAIGQDAPALIYISSYFRSNLHLGLIGQLRELSRRHVIALDHGRVNPGADNPQCAIALRQAFQHGLVDVYFCTFREIWAFDRSPAAEEPPPQEMRTAELLASLAARLNVPPLTIIRGEEWPGEGVAYLLLDGVPHVVRDVGEQTGAPTSGVGPKNAFNAAFLKSVVGRSLTREALVQAVRSGLGAWISNC